MITKATIGITLFAGLCFGGSLLGTVAVRQQGAATPAPVQCSPLVHRLGLDPQQARLIEEANDPQFGQDTIALRTRLDEARLALAAAFESETATDDEIRAHVETVIQVHNQLERRVAEYLIAVRNHLTPAQQRQLYGMCAEKVRECGRRWRQGRGYRGNAADADTQRGRGGRGRGQGHGRGRGSGW